MRKMLVSVFLFMVILTGCTKTETTPPTDEISESPPLLIGLIPERNIFEQIERYKPLAEYLSKKTGINIKLKVLTRYGNIINNFVSAGMDGAFFGSFVYTLAHAKLGIEVIARPESIEGVSSYHGVIFVRKDSGIKTAKDMKGKTFAFVDKAVMAGYLLPLKYFRENGIEDYRTYLKEIYFAGTHDGAIYDVLNGEADIGAAKNTEYKRLSDIDRRIKNQMVIIARSPDVPENGLAVRKDLDISIKNMLKEALLNMHKVPDGKIILSDFGIQRFIVTTDDDYANVYKYAREINLDLNTYDYMND